MTQEKLNIAAIICNRVHYNETKKIFEALKDDSTPAMLYHNCYFFKNDDDEIEYPSYSLFHMEEDEKQSPELKSSARKIPAFIALFAIPIYVLFNVIGYIFIALLATLYEILNFISLGIVDFLAKPLKRQIKLSGSRMLDVWLRKPFRNGTFVYYTRIKMHQMRIRKYFKNNKTDILLLNEANTEYLTEVYVREAHKRNIAVVVIPYTFCTPAEPAESYYHNPNHNLANYRFKKHFIRSFMPEWLYVHKKKTMLRLPFNQALVQKLLRVQSPQPWIQESTHAEAIISASQYDTDYLINIGIPAHQIKTIGIPNQDYLYNEYINASQNRERLYKELKLKPRSKLAVLAVPPNALGMGQAAGEVEFKSYNDILDFWIEALCADAEKNGWNIILAPHPTLDKSHLKKYETPYCKLSFAQTSKILPICDLFIASISTTIKWANTCGIPVLNYDVYKLRYEDFSKNTATINTEDKQEYLEYQHRLFGDDDYLQKVKKDQKALMDYWGILDGKCTERLISLLKSLGHKA
jgi:hypothetical protein